jgi:hypothetical protein
MGFGKTLDADRVIAVDKDSIAEKKAALRYGAAAALPLVVRPDLIEWNRELPGLRSFQQVASIFTEENFWSAGCLSFEKSGCSGGAFDRIHAAIIPPALFL